MVSHDSRRLYEEFGNEGVEVLLVERGKGAHVKIRCRFFGHEFTYATSRNTKDPNLTQKRVADLRRIKRAVRRRDMTTLNKFKVVRNEA